MSRVSLWKSSAGGPGVSSVSVFVHGQSNWILSLRVSNILVNLCSWLRDETETSMCTFEFARTYSHALMTCVHPSTVYPWPGLNYSFPFHFPPIWTWQSGLRESLLYQQAQERSTAFLSIPNLAVLFHFICVNEAMWCLHWLLNPVSIRTTRVSHIFWIRSI